MAGSCQLFYFRYLLQAVQLDNHICWLFHRSGCELEAYKNNVLQTITNRFYQVPSTLPKGGFLFIDCYDLQVEKR